MITFLSHPRLGQEECAGCIGKGAELRDKDCFLKAKMHIEAQAFGHHSFAKGGICKSGTQSIPQINQGLGGKTLAVLFTASLLLCNLLETRQCNYPSLTRAWSFRVPGLALFGLKLGKTSFVFPFCFTQKLLNGVHNHTWAAPQGAPCFIDPTSCEGGGGCRIGEVTSRFL